MGHTEDPLMRTAAAPPAAGVSPRLLRTYAGILWVLAFLFFLRVLGQVLVALFAVEFLPPMEEWYSGLIPYSILLPSQGLILLLLVKIAADFSRGYGFAVVPRPGFGRFLRGFAYVYFASMVLRYAISMALHPERRWLGGSVPIVFHWVLAAYCFVWGHSHRRQDYPDGHPRGRPIG